MNTIRHDFRSDTVTRPDAGMRRAMAEAEVGDDVFGDDPTVNLLEQRMAGLVNKEAALFVPSGTMSNLLALMSHCGRGDEYIAGQKAHLYVNEAGGAAVLGSIQPQPIAHQADGTMALEEIEAAIKPDDSHYARTKVIALENTFGGRALPMTYMTAVADIARRHGLGLHLDGARAFNAAAALGWASRRWRRRSTRCRSASRRGWARRWGRSSSAAVTSSTSRGAIARCWAGAYASPACWPRPVFTPSTTMWRGWSTTIGVPARWRRA